MPGLQLVVQPAERADVRPVTGLHAETALPGERDLRALLPRGRIHLGDDLVLAREIAEGGLDVRPERSGDGVREDGDDKGPDGDHRAVFESRGSTVVTPAS
ncbi:hypothetical protein [Actinomadura madurae]|uniref:hypothetical protein n=1 Tax=Actinomadura madurae TaxID=1993 RepID=UPI0020D232BD|nr:hypothetical protein [Actinomadura madurae]MCQ0015635.1 hypothetical protein [Actinomadura madurae]